ncbi:MAG: 1,4-dihydroxy-6-naphthoate synthase [Bacteroidales bacterium]|nr:1,4-dihydroxy-6-naphthoate synthase [Bacteroidales bacterium]
MKLSLGFSTCPNDTFVFDAMVHQKIDTEGLEFEPFLGDVEELNKRAFLQELDITKLSYHAYAFLSESYMILDSGSALGEGNGPILLSKRKVYPNEVNDLTIAIPGKYTTANLLLGIAYPYAQQKQEYLFSDIEEAILSDEVDAGLVIHENRFTYASKGLQKVIDLGEFWEKLTEELIPLGGIVILRSLDNEAKAKVNRVLKKSIEFAFKHPEEVMPYVKQYAQEMDENVMKKHIGLYVNEYTIELGEKGKSAIRRFYELAKEKELIPAVNKNLFVSENLG